ncbi:MAG: alpha/beta family hydrolase [Alphaproteobacteria bacterium]
MNQAEPVSVPIAGAAPVSGLWQTPATPRACLVLAHGAGAGMTHPAMAAIAQGFAARGIATLRYQFPYMERGSKRVDPPAVAHAAVRAAVAEAARRAPTLALFAGGKSFGGRMSSQAQAIARLDLLRAAVAGLEPRATLKLFADADHAFHVPAKTGRKDAELLAEILDAAAGWMAAQ